MQGISRRDLFAASASALALGGSAKAAPAPAAPASPVSIAKIANYDGDLLGEIMRMLDEIGGIGPQVRGKTVAMKVNLTGSSGRGRRSGLRASQTTWVHENIVGALTAAFAKLGARRVRIMESTFRRQYGAPLEDTLLNDGWDVNLIRSAAPVVEFEDTNGPGSARQYSTFKVKSRPYIYPAFMLNHAYEDCDFFVSVAKMKTHDEMGLTLSMKNLFGITPELLYGQGQRPPGSSNSVRERVFHYGQVQPPDGVPQEIDFKSNRYEGWRLPRILTDICGARPVDLAVIDGIETLIGGEGAGIPGSKPGKPGLLVIGHNCVCTDSVAAATMGYNPRGTRHEAPFKVYKVSHSRPGEQMIPPEETHQYAENIMLLGEAAGLGSADLSKIDVRGVPIAKAIYDFEAHWKGQVPV